MPEKKAEKSIATMRPMIKLDIYYREFLQQRIKRIKRIKRTDLNADDAD